MFRCVCFCSQISRTVNYRRPRPRAVITCHGVTLCQLEVWHLFLWAGRRLWLGDAQRVWVNGGSDVWKAVIWALWAAVCHTWRINRRAREESAVHGMQMCVQMWLIKESVHIKPLCFHEVCVIYMQLKLKKITPSLLCGNYKHESMWWRFITNQRTGLTEMRMTITCD